MCDSLCIRTGAGMLFAKNSDRHPDEPQVVEWHDPRPAGACISTQYLTIDDSGACGFVGSRPDWLWGVEHGVNEFGVAVGNEKIWTTDNPKHRPAALLGMDIVRLTLERARSADEAASVITELLAHHGQGGSGEPHHDEPYDSSFLVADAGGGFVVETSNRSWVLRPVGTGAAVSNRVSLGTDWTRASPDIAPGTDFDDFRWKRMPTAIADGRLAVTRATVEAGGATPRTLAHTLRHHGDHGRHHGDHGRHHGDHGRHHGDHGRHHGDHENPGAGEFTVCMHRRDAHAQTTASMIVDIPAEGPRRVWTALGNPCLSVYVPGFPPSIAPELASVSQWQRFAGLRDRIEADPAARASTEAVLRAVEAELWEEADAAGATGSRAHLDRFTRGAYRAVDAALHRLGV